MAHIADVLMKNSPTAADIQADPELSACLSWLLLRWSVDPILFSIECPRTIPMPYQGQILLDVADAPAEIYAFYGLDPAHPKRKVLAPSGHGLGKTRVIATLTWWHTLTIKFSKRIITAPTSDQITGQLWGELRKLYRRMKQRWPVLTDDWEVLGSSIVHRNPEFGDWCTVARTARPDRPEGLQGTHALDADDEFGELAEFFNERIDETPSGGLLVVIEEASGVDDTIRKTLQGSLSEAGARLFAPGNPTRPDGWFAEDIDKPHKYAVHCLDCRMSNREERYEVPYRDVFGRTHQFSIRGFVDPGYWKNILEECDGDEDSDYFRVRVRGVKPRSALEACLKSHWLDAAENREPDPGSKTDPVILGLDFGLFGDKHALAARRGYTMIDGEEWLPKDTPVEITLEAVERAKRAQEVYRARYIIGDANGVGRGAMESLHKYYREHPELRCTVILFNSGNGAFRSKRFYTRRDEMWLHYGRAWFSDPRACIPKIPGFKRQATAPQAHDPNANNRWRVETKKETKKRTGQSSGNLIDAFLETLLVVPHQEQEQKPMDDKPKINGMIAHYERLDERIRVQREGLIR